MRAAMTFAVLRVPRQIEMAMRMSKAYVEIWSTGSVTPTADVQPR